jgi:hypothetical protein
MKRALLISVMLLASVVGAHAEYSTTYHDTIRPHGKPRSDAIFNASVDACYAQTGLDRALPDTPAFKQCMLKRGYRWESQRLVVTDPAPPLPPPGSVGTFTYDDVAPGPQRSEAAEQAATRACDRGIADRIGTPAFDSCMTQRGWRFAGFSPTPQDDDSSPAAVEDASTPSADIPDIGAMERNQQEMDDAATAASQAQLISANIAAATQP